MKPSNLVEIAISHAAECPDKTAYTFLKNGRDVERTLTYSQLDRKARIELGAHWGRTYDNDAARVMDTLIIPQFKERNFSLGILEGVRGMHGSELRC